LSFARARSWKKFQFRELQSLQSFGFVQNIVKIWVKLPLAGEAVFVFDKYDHSPYRPPGYLFRLRAGIGSSAEKIFH
jgi:hypothetical protein